VLIHTVIISYKMICTVGNVCRLNVRGGKRKLTSPEDGVDAEVVENSAKNEGKVTETKRPKRQAATVDKVKVTGSQTVCLTVLSLRSQCRPSTSNLECLF